jgi:hypothetical protein
MNVSIGKVAAGAVLAAALAMTPGVAFAQYAQATTAASPAASPVASPGSATTTTGATTTTSAVTNNPQTGWWGLLGLVGLLGLMGLRRDTAVSTTTYDTRP